MYQAPNLSQPPRATGGVAYKTASGAVSTDPNVLGGPSTPFQIGSDRDESMGKGMTSVPGVGIVPQGQYGSQPPVPQPSPYMANSPYNQQAQQYGQQQTQQLQGPLAQQQPMENIETPATTPAGQIAQARLQNLNAGSQAAPVNASEARIAVSKATPPTPAPEYKPTPEFIQQAEPVMQSYIQNVQAQQQEIAAKGYLAQSIKGVASQQLAQLDEKAMNMKAMIEGTDDDIRAEIGKAGGFVSESQVQALANSRNKDLIRSYNSILIQRQAMQSQLQSQVQLAQADREFAQERLDNNVQLFNIQEKIQAHNKSTIQSQVANVGYGGMTELYQNDAYGLSLAEQTLGLPPGALSNPLLTSKLDARSQRLDTSWQTIGGNKVLVDNQTGKVIRNAGPSGEGGSGGSDTGPIGIISGRPYTPKQFSYLERLNQNVSTNQTYQSTSAMKKSVNNVITSLELRTGVADIAAINQFQKVIDEGAVTRDQDVALLQSAGSFVDKLLLKVTSLKTGEKLPEEQRAEMRELVNSIYSAQVNSLSQDDYIRAKIIEAQTNGVSVADSILGQIVPDTTAESNGILTSPDGKQGVRMSELTPAELEEAKKEGWK